MRPDKFYLHHYCHFSNQQSSVAMKSSSANRSTLIKIVEEGSTIKALNASINYNQGYDALKKMIELSLRLSPQDPVYNVEQIIVTGRDGSDLSLEEFHKDLRENLTAGATPSKGSAPNKIVLSVSFCVSSFTIIILSYQMPSIIMRYLFTFHYLRRCTLKNHSTPIPTLALSVADQFAGLTTTRTATPTRFGRLTLVTVLLYFYLLM